MSNGTSNPIKIVKVKRSDSETSFALKFKLTPVVAEVAVLRQWGGCLNMISQAMWDERTLTWLQFLSGNHEKKPRHNAISQSNLLPELKKIPGFEFLSAVPSQLFQQKARDLDASFQRFFKGEADFPVRRSRKKHGFSMKFPDPKQFNVNWLNKNNAEISLPKNLVLRFKTGGRKIPKNSRVRSCTIRGNSRGDEWTIAFNVGIEKEEFKTIHKSRENNGEAIGIDRGVKIALQLSSESQFNFPEQSVKNIEDKITRLQRLNRNKKKFSINWVKAQKNIGRLHSKIANIRLDFIHKSTTAIAKNHGLVVIEDLKLRNMSKSAKGTVENPGRSVRAKSGLNRSILRMGVGEQTHQLEYKCGWYGSHLVKVNPRNTSLECSKCGHTDKKNRKSQSRFECISCGFQMNADLNASKVILARGHRVLACGEIVDEKILSGLSLEISTKQEPLKQRRRKTA